MEIVRAWMCVVGAVGIIVGCGDSSPVNGDCPPDMDCSACGNGVIDLDVGEVCDDDNRVSDDGCSVDCRSDETCGNGYIDVSRGEVCDAGIANADTPNAPCRTNCELPRCGDGITDDGEHCDDGNLIAGDGCAPDCLSDESCGNGIVDVGEACDDFNHVVGDGCSADCRSDETCGNGYLDTALGEQCEDAYPRGHSGDGCSSACQLEADTWAGAAGVQPQTSSNNAVFDATRGKVVMFGSRILSGGVVQAQHWEWNGAWSRLTPLTLPPQSSESAMAFDSARSRTLLFGGSFGGVVYGTTWAWDGVNWTALAPATSPPARTGHAMAFDAARGRVVLFAGNGFGDTWEWDGTTWADRSPALSPSQRNGHALAYDAARGRVVLFGGCATGGLYLNDTWEWDGTTWTALSPSTVPPGRCNHALAYNAERGRVTLFGGGGSNNVIHAGTWEWDGTNWTLLTPTTPMPIRTGHAMTYDSIRRAVVLFGGFGSMLTAYDTSLYRVGLTSPSTFESCADATTDADADGLSGCADPDCWGRCDPTCPPLVSCAPARQRCGDGLCNASLEDAALCPADCP